MTDQVTVIPRDKRTPTTDATDTLYKLLAVFEEWEPGKAGEEFIADIIKNLFEDDRADGDKLLDAVINARRDEKDKDDSVAFLASIVAACAYCVQAMKADADGRRDEAWTFASDAHQWHGMIYASWSANKKPSHQMASKGGKANNARYDPLREFARGLAEARNFPSARNAAMNIAPEVLELSKQLGVNMKPSQAVLTISSWLKGIPFASKRRT